MSDKSEFRGNDYMPIYEPKDYEDVIARIQKKVIEKNIKMGECLRKVKLKRLKKAVIFSCHKHIVCFKICGKWLRLCGFSFEQIRKFRAKRFVPSLYA